MTLHPNISKSELDQYTQLCNEYRPRARKVFVDEKTLSKIREIAKSDQYQGIQFIQK